MSEQEIGRLNNFIFNLQRDINLVVSRIDIIIPEQRELHELVTRAWRDVAPRFDEISLYIVDENKAEELQKQLRARGLTGIQLMFKLSVYNARRDEFRQQWEEFELASRDKKRRGRVFTWQSYFMRWTINRLFDIGDVILDSLGFIPGIDAVKEIKGTIENVLL
jgi:hypothetical protein